MNDLQKGNISFEIHQKVIEAKQDIERSFIKLGGLLKEIRDKKIYESLGYDTFESYIAQPELSLHRATVYSLIGIYTDFFQSEKSNQLDIDTDRLVKIGHSKLERVRQYKDRDDFEDWLCKAETLSLSDLSQAIHEDKGLPDVISVPAQNTIEIVCPFCGKKFAFYPQK